MHTNTLYKAPKAKKNRDKSQSQKTSLQKHHTRSLTSKIPHNSAQCLGKKQGYKSRILTTSDRNVSFVNAKFQIVQVKVGKSVPEKLLTLPLPQDYHNTKPKKNIMMIMILVRILAMVIKHHRFIHRSFYILKS